MTTPEPRAQTEDFIFALGATERLRALVHDDDIMVMSVTDGTFAIYAEEQAEFIEEDLTKNELMDRLDDAAVFDLNRIFGDGSLDRTNADLHPTIQRLAREEREANDIAGDEAMYR